MYDVAVIGGGPGGYRTAELLAQKKYSVALVEKKSIGGVCLNAGCIPFKTYLSIAERIHNTETMLTEGVLSEINTCIHHSAIIEKTQRIISTLRKSLEKTLLNSGVNIIYSEVIDVKGYERGFEIYLNDNKIEATYLILAMGATDDLLRNDAEFQGKNMIKSSGILELQSFSKEVDIIGGGAVGIETASFLNAIGTSVTLYEKNDHIGGHVDKEIANGMQRIMQRRGIIIHTGEDYHGDSKNIIVAIGRKANKASRIIDSLQVKCDVNGIIIDAFCRTSVPNVFACGDITGKMMLAHVAYMQARVISDCISGAGTTVDYTSIPQIIYADPCVISIGMTEEDCLEIGKKYEAKTTPMTYSGKYYAENGNDGALAKMIIDEKKRIIGFHMVARDASEIAHIIEVMMINKMDIDAIRKMVFAHPTYGEIIGVLADCFA